VGQRSLAQVHSSMMACSTASERMFSKSGKSDTALRTARKPQTVQDAFMVRENYDLLSVYKRVVKAHPVSDDAVIQAESTGNKVPLHHRKFRLKARRPAEPDAKKRKAMHRSASMPQGRGFTKRLKQAAPSQPVQLVLARSQSTPCIQ